MRQIYKNAKTVLSWVGPDTPDHQAVVAVDSILAISDILCEKLDVSAQDLRFISNIYQEIILRNRTSLPLPSECGFGTEATWISLRWFYSHPYFTRVWVIQEIGANNNRILHCGPKRIEWERVDLVAGYIMMEPTFSKSFGFTDTYCWWVATMTELTRNPKNWLAMLYLASTYSCIDARDVIYGLRGAMEFSIGADLFEPNYSKPTLEVYRDFVEAAILNFQSTNVLIYVIDDLDSS